MTTAPTVLLAKSKRNGGVTLLHHTEHVMQAIEYMAGHMRCLEPVLACKAAALHDVGKAHPAFQLQLQQADGFKTSTSLYEKRQWDFVHRHELSSLLLLPCFPQHEWDCLIEMIVSHHKSLEGDASRRGLMDLVADYDIDHIFDNHSKQGEQWFVEAVQLLREMGFAVADVDKQKAREAWDYLINYCEKCLEKKGWSRRRGLLMAADHFASAMANRTASEIANRFRIPDISVFHPVEPGGILFPLADVAVNDPRNHTLLVAPTGAGKTDFLMRRCAGKRIFYILPYQASINAMWARFCGKMPAGTIHLQHAAASLVIKEQGAGDFEEEYPLHGLVGSAVKVLTPHQLATIIFGLPGYELVMLDLEGTAVILDEIHTYADVSRSMVLEIVKVLLQLNCSVHIGTATMPTAMYRELLQLLGGEASTYQVALTSQQLQSYNRHRVYKLDDWQQADAVVAEAMAAKEKLLIVCNTVQKAQDIFNHLQKQYGHHSHMLIHSRFRRKDRARKERLLREVFEGGEGDGARPCWVVATQVVEVSLDISFDRMITACAPLDALVQRFGRINRRRAPHTLGKQRPVYVIAPEGDQRPYNQAVVEKTFSVLPDNGAMLQEDNMQALLDLIYPTIPPVVDIAAHIIWKDGAVGLPPLCNNPSSVLQNTLDISAATCILECDREAYETGTWDVRAGLEIPVSFHAIAHTARQHNYIQLEKTGSRPYIIPQTEREHGQLGLIFREHDSFL